MRRTTDFALLLCTSAMLAAVLVFAGCKSEDKTPVTNEQPTPKPVEAGSKSPAEPAPPEEPGPAPPVEPGPTPPTEPGLEPPSEPTVLPPSEPEVPDEGTLTPPSEPAVPDAGTLTPPSEPGVPDEGTLTPPSEPAVPDEGTLTPPSEPGVPDEGTLTPPSEPAVPDEGTLTPPSEPAVPDEGTLTPPSEPGVPDEGTLTPPSEPGVPDEGTLTPPSEPAVEPELTPPAEPEAAKEPDLGPPLVEKADDLQRLDPVKPLWVDQKNGRVVMVGQVCQTDAPLEMFACLKDTKEHESVVTVDVEAFKVHAGLLAIGAEAGHPVQWTPEYAPATGSKIEITVSYKDDQGKVQTARAQEWVYDTATRKALTHDWVFGGSGFWEDEISGTREYKAEGGDFICVANFASAMLDLPIKSSQADSARMFKAFTEHIPPVGTPVTMILTPKLKKAR